MKLICHNLKIFPTIIGIGLAFSLLFVSGCFQAVLLSPEEIRANTSNDIVVATRDGRRVGFASDNYSIVDSVGHQAIRGQGKLYLPASSQYQNFAGEISIKEIESISTSEKTSMFYVSIIAAGVAIGYVALWLIALDGRGFGG